VASHIQALKQTKKWVGEHLSPEIVTIEMEDTAISAKMLGEGLLKDDTAVICSLEAGLQNGLTLMAQNIEDDKRNRTEFRLLKMPDPQYMEKESLSDQLISEKSIVDKLIQVAAILAIVASSILMSMFDMSPWETACTVSGYVVMLIWLILNLHKRLINRTFIGYWKYYTIPLDIKDDIQHYHVPRIVEIKEVDGKLQLFGYTSVMSEKHISFMSDKVNTQQTDASHGYLLYEYVSDIRALDLGGCVLLKWYKKHSYAKVKRMTGQYFGVKSREMGTLLYQRISKEEFDNISRCDFLRNAEG
jgi:hypothetical protein